MTRYLVVAHQTATSPALLQKVTQLASEDADASFSILVPETPIDHMLAWEEGETSEIAQRRATEAMVLFESHGLNVQGIGVGDASPILAISDELRQNPDVYDAIILSTFPPGISRWLKMDDYSQAGRKFDLPVIHVVAEKQRA